MVRDAPTQADIQILLNALGTYHINGDEALALCPFHADRNPSFYFNTTSALYVCFSCGTKGNARLLARYLGVSITGSDYYDDGDFLLEQVNAILSPAPSKYAQTVLSEEYLKRYSFDTDHWSGRGYTEATINRFQLGYDPVTNAATIPVRTPDGELIGVIKRNLDPNAINKYLYPKGFKKNLNMFGAWEIEKMPAVDTVVITEGSADAMKVWQAGYPALAQFGSSMSTSQQRLMIRLGIEKVILMYDNDAAGKRATDRALGMSPESGKYEQQNDLTCNFTVAMVQYEPGLHDPGDATEAQVCNMVESVRYINSI